MDVLVTVDQRYDRTPDGVIWTPDQASYGFFARYLAVFDNVKVVARVRDVPGMSESYLRAEGERVKVLPIPFYHGLVQFLTKWWAVRQTIGATVTYRDAVVLRVASPIAAIAATAAWKRHFPYAVEVVNDPLTAFSKGAIRHPLRPFIRWSYVRTLRKVCQNAAAASYVTEHYLQGNYPCPSHTVQIADGVPAQMYAERPRDYRTGPPASKLIFIGSLSMMYKAPDVLLHAVKRCVDQGYDLKLTMIGDGIFRPAMEALSAELGLASRVEFLGQLPGAVAVRNVLTESDLFILPSWTEGLPRALLEAMAVGLACIATNVAGIPELLPPEDMVAPGDAAALAAKILYFIDHPDYMTSAAARNFSVAQRYAASDTRQKQQMFYSYVREQTEAWLGEQGNNDLIASFQTSGERS